MAEPINLTVNHDDDEPKNDSAITVILTGYEYKEFTYSNHDDAKAGYFRLVVGAAVQFRKDGHPRIIEFGGLNTVIDISTATEYADYTAAYLDALYDMDTAAVLAEMEAHD